GGNKNSRRYAIFFQKRQRVGKIVAIAVVERDGGLGAFKLFFRYLLRQLAERHHVIASGNKSEMAVEGGWRYRQHGGVTLERINAVVEQQGRGRARGLGEHVRALYFCFEKRVVGAPRRFKER